MSRFLFIVPPFLGHINPTLGIGGSLLEKGHKVTWIGLKEIPNEFIPDGGRFVVIQQEADQQERLDCILDKQDSGPSMVSVDILKFAMEETYIPFCDMMMNGVLDIIDEFKPHIILHDENMFCGPIAATLRKIPYATSIAVPPGTFLPSGFLPKIEEWQTNLILNLQEKYGIQSSHKIVNSNDLNISYTSKEFVNGDLFPQEYKFVGPIIKGRPVVGSFDWERLKNSNKPIVYVSVGTVLNDIRTSFFSKVVDALKDQDVLVVAATHPKTLPHWPDNFIVQSFVPQSELLSYVNSIIYHGGFNTVNEALWNNIPLIIIPIAYDQFHIAQLVVNSGSGVRLKFRRLTSKIIQQAFIDILNDPSYLENAKKMGATLREAGGTKSAVSHIEDMVFKYYKK